MNLQLKMMLLCSHIIMYRSKLVGDVPYFERYELFHIKFPDNYRWGFISYFENGINSIMKDQVEI